MGYFNKELNTLGFNIYKVCEELKPFISNYWSVNGNLKTSVKNKILTDGSLGFMVNFSNPYFISINNNFQECSSKVVLHGQTRFPTFLYFENEVDIIGIRFKTGCAHGFFSEDLSSFENKNFDFLNHKNCSFDSLYKKLKKLKSNEEKIICIENFLINYIKVNKITPCLKVEKVIRYINYKKGDVLLEDICKKFMFSMRTLERIFKKELGLSAKLFTRIIRLRYTRKRLSNLDVDNFSLFCQENGFYDQAHFIKEFKYFMSETPKNYFERKLNMAKEFNYKKF